MDDIVVTAGPSFRYNPTFVPHGTTTSTDSPTSIAIHLTSLIHAYATATNTRNFSPASQIWQTLHPLFRHEGQGFALSDSINCDHALTRDEWLAAQERVAGNYPDYQHKIHNVKVEVQNRETARAYVNAEWSGIPAGVVRTHMSVLTFQCESGVWVLMKREVLPGLATWCVNEQLVP